MEIAKKTYLELLDKAEKYDALLPTYQKMYVELHARQRYIDRLEEAVDNYQKQLKK
jgi:flagellar biosynthesis chaperone FliJ